MPRLSFQPAMFQSPHVIRCASIKDPLLDGTPSNDDEDESVPEGSDIQAWFELRETPETELDDDSVADAGALPLTLTEEDELEVEADDASDPATPWFQINEPTDASETDDPGATSALSWLERGFKETSTPDAVEGSENSETLDPKQFETIQVDLPALDDSAETFADPDAELETAAAAVARPTELYFREVYTDDQPSCVVLPLTYGALIAGPTLRRVGSDWTATAIESTSPVELHVVDLVLLDAQTVVVSLSSGELGKVDLSAAHPQIAVEERWPRFARAPSLSSTRDGVLAGTLTTACVCLTATSVQPVLDGQTLLAFGQGTPGGALVLQNGAAVLTDACEPRTDEHFCSWENRRRLSSVQLSMDGTVRVALIKDVGVYAGESPNPARHFPSFARAQAACAAQLADRAVVWLAQLGEHGETEIIELDLTDGKATLAGRVSFVETEDSDGVVERMVWDGSQRVLWLCSDAGTRALKRLEA